MASERAGLFFILSTERTRDSQSCVWWRPDGAGYTTSNRAGRRYTREECARHSDPPHHLCIPCDVVEVPAARARRFAKYALTVSRFDAAHAAQGRPVIDPTQPGYPAPGKDGAS